MTSKEIYQNIDARLTHLEDATLDNREILIKLIKQGNQIVEFLKDFEVENVDEYMDYPVPVELNDERDSKFRAMKDLIDDYLIKNKDLREFEKELKKHKDKLTPGIVGKS
tara:strand:- start:74 stop:403 length:330 start_codon:yes stop_codon:yes gene_type:complete